MQSAFQAGEELNTKVEDTARAATTAAEEKAARIVADANARADELSQAAEELFVQAQQALAGAGGAVAEQVDKAKADGAASERRSSSRPVRRHGTWQLAGLRPRTPAPAGSSSERSKTSAVASSRRSGCCTSGWGASATACPCRHRVQGGHAGAGARATARARTGSPSPPRRPSRVTTRRWCSSVLPCGVLGPPTKGDRRRVASSARWSPPPGCGPGPVVRWPPDRPHMGPSEVWAGAQRRPSSPRWRCACVRGRRDGLAVARQGSGRWASACRGPGRHRRECADRERDHHHRCREGRGLRGRHVLLDPLRAGEWSRRPPRPGWGHGQRGRGLRHVAERAGGDRARFDAAWAWTQTHLLQPSGLLAWRCADGPMTIPSRPPTPTSMRPTRSRWRPASSRNPPTSRRRRHGLGHREPGDGRRPRERCSSAGRGRWGLRRMSTQATHRPPSWRRWAPSWATLRTSGRSRRRDARLRGGVLAIDALPPDWVQLNGGQLLALDPPAGLQ